jgi:hypothetical protein
MHIHRRTILPALLGTTILAACTAAQVQSTLATLAAGWAAIPSLLTAAGAIIGTIIGSYVMRYVTTARIGGVFSAAPAPKGAA